MDDLNSSTVSADRWPISEQNLEIVDKDTSKFIVNISRCGLIPIITVLGIVGNVISFIVLLRQRTRDRTRVVLIGLTISDTLYLFNTCIRTVPCLIRICDSQWGSNFRVLVIPHWFTVGLIFARITSMLTMVISTERCLAVFYPLKVRAILTRLRTVKVVVSVFIGVAIAMLPLTLCYVAEWRTNPTTNRSIAILKRTPFYQSHKTIMDNYNTVVLVALVRIFPCVVVSLCTVAVLISLKKNREFRTLSSSSTNSSILLEERKVTVTLVSLTMVYLVCLTPGTALTLANRYVPGFSSYGKYQNLFLLFSNLTLVLECINSASTFIVYMKTNRHFKVTFKKIFCKSHQVMTSREHLNMLSNGTSSSNCRHERN